VARGNGLRPRTWLAVLGSFAVGATLWTLGASWIFVRVG
jgi:hypothetical protein